MRVGEWVEAWVSQKNARDPGTWLSLGSEPPDVGPGNQTQASQWQHVPLSAKPSL